MSLSTDCTCNYASLWYTKRDNSRQYLGMSSKDLAANLRLASSYSASVSDVCRRIGLNRQQFHRYLSGQAKPSLRNLKRISDYFGLEEGELLLDHAAFRSLISIKRPLSGGLTDMSERVRNILLLTPDSLNRLRSYIGFYYNHFCPVEYPGKIMRGFIQVMEESGFVFSRNIEHHPSSTHWTTKRYDGLFVHSGDRILMFEREARSGKAIWLTQLYPSDGDQLGMSPGLTIGMAGTPAREIACYGVVLEFLGRDIDVRGTLRNCGLYDMNDPRIHPFVRRCVRDAGDGSAASFGI